MEILNDVLDHSKIEAGKLVLAPSPTSLHSVAMSAAALFRARAETKGLTLVLRIDDEVPDGVVTDGPRLKQVLLNLLSNAVKFTERGGIKLRLALQASEPNAARVRFEVQDSGMGIASDELDAELAWRAAQGLDCRSASASPRRWVAASRCRVAWGVAPASGSRSSCPWPPTPRRGPATATSPRSTAPTASKAPCCWSRTTR
jgi:hypothetical protein